jgi:putative restriction endonuclease
MRVYVGVTDGAWYRFLADRPYLTEVNFWMPGGGRGRLAGIANDPSVPTKTL